MPSDRAWLARLPAELARQGQAMTALLDLSERTATISSFSVGCSIGRGAADGLSDIDAAIGVAAPRGSEGLEQVRAVEESVVELLSGLGGLVDVLRQEDASPGVVIRRVFAQFDDRLQLDLAVIAEGEVRRGAAAPDFVPLHWSGARPEHTSGPSAHEVSGELVRDWTFLAWRAVLDADKYLRRGSLWEAHQRVHEVRELIWKLWATARGATYPWHGLSQVLDLDPSDLPPGIERTVPGLDHDELRRALAAAVVVLDEVSTAAAAGVHTVLDPAMARYCRRLLRW